MPVVWIANTHGELRFQVRRVRRADSPRGGDARVRFDGEGDYLLDPPEPDECPHHRGHEAGACELCDWELALDEALEAFDALEPLALPERDEDHDLPIAAE